MKAKSRIIILLAAVLVMAAIALATETDLILRLAPYPYEEPIPSPGEGADEVWVDTTPGVPGGEMTLQEAVAAGFISLDTKCDSAGNCPQVCIGGDCRASWPGGGSVITQLNQGSGITLSPNPITATGSISRNYSQAQQRVSGTCPAGQSIRVVNQTGTVVCEPDSTCATSGTCGQVCIGRDCENSWTTGHTFALGTLGSCQCDNRIARANGPCAAVSSTGTSSAFAGGECCICTT